MQNSFLGTQKSPVASLNVQYRMHPEICKFPNSFFYNNKLITATETTDHQFPIQPYTVINLESFQSTSRTHDVKNKDEAIFIALMIKEIRTLTNDNYTIGVITPYQSQKDAINDAFV